MVDKGTSSWLGQGRNFNAETKETERPPLKMWGLSGFGILWFYRDCLRAGFPVGAFWAGWLSFFTLLLTLANSALTPVAIFAESTLYRAAACARLEFFSSGCLGL